MVKHAASHVGKSAWRAWRGVMMGAFWLDIRWSRPSRKASARGASPPVPQTDTGGQVENTKAIERILVKELGKSLPCLRYKGDPLG